jgi:hypothetical protein
LISFARRKVFSGIDCFINSEEIINKIEDSRFSVLEQYASNNDSKTPSALFAAVMRFLTVPTKNSDKMPSQAYLDRINRMCEKYFEKINQL